MLVSDLRKHGVVKETLEDEHKDMVNFGINLVIITRVMHSMTNGLGKAPINGLVGMFTSVNT